MNRIDFCSSFSPITDRVGRIPLMEQFISQASMTAAFQMATMIKIIESQRIEK
jgi:hypothetical protein